MRILWGDFVIEVDRAVRIGKKLIFTLYNGECFHTKDYYHESIAHCMLNDLAKNGYIAVDELYAKKGF